MSTQNIYEKYKYDTSVVNNSKTWFQQQSILLAKERINRQTFHRLYGIKTRFIRPGNMYMFFYDPKHKDTLPMYDMYPLVFPFQKLEDGFLGLNMHYLPYKMRFILFDALLRYKNTKELDENTRLKYSWNILQNMSKHTLAEKCVKRYLNEHIVSHIKMVNPTDWSTTLMLPVEQFAKMNKNKVWGQ